jgi:uncharacterized protein (DUF1015 family)
MRLRSFSGLVPASNDIAARLVSPPYDVVSTAEARAILDVNPDSFLAVVRPDAVVPQGTSPYADLVYNTAAQKLRGLVDGGLLVQSPQDAVYVYEQANAAAGIRQRGLVALANVSDYDADVIKKHEFTRPEKENDRTRLAETLAAHTGPVFLTYRDVDKIDAIVEETVAATDALFDVTGEDNVRHRVWRLDDSHSARLITLFEQDVPVCYIADGHHRAAAAARVARSQLTSRNDAAHANEDASWFLAVLFPQTQLTILPYNRLVHDINGMSQSEFIGKLSTLGDVKRLDVRPTGPPPKSFVYLCMDDDAWFSLALPKSTATDTAVADQLDSSVLQSSVLGPLLAIHDPRVDSRIEFVGGVHGMENLAKRVRSLGGSGVAFAMHPVSADDLMQIADRGSVMPPKSTWFEPKLRSGFFVHRFRKSANCRLQGSPPVTR